MEFYIYILPLAVGFPPYSSLRNSSGVHGGCAVHCTQTAHDTQQHTGKWSP